MAYQVPLQDIRFVLYELAGLQEILRLPGFEDLSADLVDAVLEENARFVQQELAPLNTVGDTQPAQWHDGHVQTSPGFRAAFQAFAQGGWQGLAHEPSVGGQGLPKLVAAPVMESMNAGNLALSLCPLLTDGVIEALTLVGTDEQKARLIPPLIEGRWTGTMNLTEPQAGSDLALLKTRAVRQEDGSYRLFGQKIFITYGDHDMAENIIHLVLARTPDAPKGVKGISLFIVPRQVLQDDGSPGPRNDVYCASIEHKLGIHGSPTAVLLYGAGKGEVGEGARADLIGQENHGLEYMFIMMNAARYAVGLQGVAVADRALQQAQAYAAERVQGNALEGSDGPVTIDHHPDVARMLGCMQGLTEGARALAYVAAAYRDQAAHAADASQREQARAIYEYSVPIVKGFCTETAVEVASLGIQVHGGMGYIEETGAAQYYRDARILPIYEGTTAIQANDFVGRKLLRDGGQVATQQMAAMRDTVAALRALDAGEHRPATVLIAQRLEDAVQAYQAALDFVLVHAATNVRGVFAGSVPCLMLAGTVHAGWQLARAAQLAVTGLQTGNDDPFLQRKLATAVQYAVHILPRAAALAAAVEHGDLADRYGQPV